MKLLTHFFLFVQFLFHNEKILQKCHYLCQGFSYFCDPSWYINIFGLTPMIGRLPLNLFRFLLTDNLGYFEDQLNIILIKKNLKDFEIILDVPILIAIEHFIFYDLIFVNLNCDLT